MRRADYLSPNGSFPNTVANEQSRGVGCVGALYRFAAGSRSLALVRLRQPVNVVVTGSEAVEERKEEPVVQVPQNDISEPGTPSDDPSAGEAETDVSVTEPPTAKPKRQVPTTSRRSAPRQVTIMTSINPPSDSGQARLVDQWQERRQRRVNRKPQNHHSSDLFRIREIFEGPRRNRRLNN